MSKRKQEADNEDEDSDIGLIDVDFEFFDPNPQIDYHALKRLLRQLFQGDSELFHLHEFAELILSQPLVGTTVKTDGRESDPYAVLTVLNLHVHQNHPSIKALVAYLLLKSASNVPFHAALQTLLGPANLSSSNHVGFVFCERLINMPVQVIPPMYRMLANEVKWAIDDNEPYNFSQILFISRTYRLSPEEEAAMHSAAHPAKRQKIPNTDDSGPSDGVYSFHPEDEYIQKVASHTLDYSFSSAEPREKDSFGLDTGGRMMLIPADRFQELVASLNEAYTVPS